MFGTMVRLSLKKKNPALWIILVYVFVTGAWILFSDKLVSRALTSETITNVSILKGWFYTAITACILYQLIKSSFAEIVTSQQKLALSEKQLQLIVDTIPALVSYVDAEKRYAWVNRGYEEALGIDADAICGRHVEDVLGEAAWKIIHPYVERALAGEPVAFESSIADKQGLVHLYSVTYSPNRDKDGTVRGFVALIRNITRQKQDEQALVSCNRRLIELEENLRKLLAAELHDELGPDLTALNFTLSLANDCPVQTTGCRFFEHLHDAERLLEGMGRKLRGIIADLRPPVLEDYGLEAALRWHMEQMAKRTTIDLRLLIEGSIPRLPGDRELALFRIAHEALTNAVKHSRATQVTVTLAGTDTTIRLSVCDNGIGFDRATAVPATAGWGLTIMRNRADMLGGAFNLDPGPGTGSCIHLEIPKESGNGYQCTDC